MERYVHLTEAQTTARLETIDRQYWDAMDYLAAIATDRADLMNRLQEIHEQEPRNA